jgi:hypothetical protein
MTVSVCTTTAVSPATITVDSDSGLCLVRIDGSSSDGIDKGLFIEQFARTEGRDEPVIEDLTQRNGVVPVLGSGPVILQLQQRLIWRL